jgi:hypothetical protein
MVHALTLRCPLESGHLSVTGPDRIGLVDLRHGRWNGELTLKVHQTLFTQTVHQPEQDQILKLRWFVLQNPNSPGQTPPMEFVPMLQGCKDQPRSYVVGRPDTFSIRWAITSMMVSSSSSSSGSSRRYLMSQDWQPSTYSS